MIGSFDTDSMSQKALVLYHANCNDGFGAAWAFNRISPYMAIETEYKPVNYGVPIEFLLDLDKDNSKHDLWVVDFSFPINDLVALAERFNQVVVLDHHKTFIDTLVPELDEHLPSNLTIVWDLARSGAGLTWDYLVQTFQPKDAAYSRPPIINYVEDRDLWKFKLKFSEEINAVISATEKEFSEWNVLNEELLWEKNTTYAKGVLLLNQHQQICEDIVKLARKVTIYDPFGQEHTGLLANCTGHFASDVGNLLAKQSGTFGGTYFADSDGSTKFSLRSIGDYDVSTIAKCYGGGGHKNASGFKLANPVPEVDGVIIWAGSEVKNPNGVVKFKQTGDTMLPQGGI